MGYLSASQVILICLAGFGISRSDPSEGTRHPFPPGYRRYDDMILPESFFNSSDERNAVPNKSLAWPGGRIPFIIDSSLARHKSKIYQAMQEYHSNTCIRFVPRTNQPQYVSIFNGSDGCYSLVGPAGQGGQELSLGDGCTDHGTIVHELGHAAGFYHEQNRSDRDDHLIINWNNIDQQYWPQFEKLEAHQNWLINDFDVSSIMLYGSLSFSIDSYSPSMEHIGGQQLLEVYQKQGLSYSDIQRVNILYGC